MLDGFCMQNTLDYTNIKSTHVRYIINIISNPLLFLLVFKVEKGLLCGRIIFFFHAEVTSAGLKTVIDGRCALVLEVFSFTCF